MASASPTCGCVTMRRTARTARMSGTTVVSDTKSEEVTFLTFNVKPFEACTGNRRNKITQNYFLICPQREGHVPVISSAVAMEPASQGNTNVTTWKTARMGLTRAPAVSRGLRGGSPFFCVLCRSLLWHFNQFVEIKRLADWQNEPQYASCCQRLIADSLVD